MPKRKHYSSEFKVKVVVEAMKEELTLAQPGSKYEVHPVMIPHQKKEFFNRVSRINFARFLGIGNILCPGGSESSKNVLCSLPKIAPPVYGGVVVNISIEGKPPSCVLVYKVTRDGR